MKRALLTWTLLLFPGSSVLAGGMGSMPMSMNMAASETVPGLSVMGLQMQTEMRTMMMPMMNELARLSGRSFDRSFMSMMIAHHQAAIDSSRAALERSQDPQVRQWAQQIIDDQQSEIQEMQSLLQPYGGPNMMLTQMQQMMKRMDMPGRIRSSSVPDRTFLEGMIPHHAGASQNSTLALQRTQTPEVLNLAEKIIDAQAKEMHDFQNWLRTHPVAAM